MEHTAQTPAWRRPLDLRQRGATPLATLGPMAFIAALDDPPWLPHPQWRLDVIEQRLVVSAGADEVYVLDEAPPEALPTLVAACQAGTARQLVADPLCGPAVRALRRLGALLPAGALQASHSPRASLHWVGSVWAEFTDALKAQGWDLLDDAAEAPLQLLVRTTATWTELLQAYQARPPTGPHLLIDLAYHHTVGLGPLVVPGETACLACLGHRLLRRWGDLPPPSEPALRRQLAGVAAWLGQAGALGTRCVERALALDLRELRLQESRVFAMPDCPVCATHHPPHLDGDRGRLNLPWLR